MEYGLDMCKKIWREKMHLTSSLHNQCISFGFVVSAGCKKLHKEEKRKYWVKQERNFRRFIVVREKSYTH